MVYVVLDKDGNTVNRILWDGESDWTPPEGCTVVKEEDYKPKKRHVAAIDGGTDDIERDG